MAVNVVLFAFVISEVICIVEFDVLLNTFHLYKVTQLIGSNVYNYCVLACDIVLLIEKSTQCLSNCRQ